MNEAHSPHAITARTPGADGDADAGRRRLVWIALAAALTAVVAVGAWRVSTHGFSARELPVYGTVPPFSLVERSGRTFGADDLGGHVWIASFIFTRCSGICPAISTTMAAVIRSVPDPQVRAVSFTVDPRRDDPATLRQYADRFGADPARWLFVTGDYGAVEHLVRDGFRLSIAELPAGERERSPEPITHSDRFVLIDPQLRIRGYYHATDPEGVAQLERDVRTLLALHA